MKTSAQLSKIRKFEAAWARYMTALQKFEGASIGTRRFQMAKRSARAAKRNLQKVCDALGETCPV